jgi:vancomycin permeability regulator SanA
LKLYLVVSIDLLELCQDVGIYDDVNGRMRQIFRWQRKWQRRLQILLAIAILTIALSESIDWIACHVNVTTDRQRGMTCGVLVLGYPSSPDDSPHPVQVVRVAAGVRAYQGHNCDRMVFSGGAVQNQIVEAKTMARLARVAGVSSDAIVLEDRARNTWENIKFSTPTLAKFDRIAIASNSLHAQRGRRYLCKQRPDLCDRTFVAAEYRPFDRFWWKMAATVHELFAWGRDLLLFG